jgi:hypothetical protein
MDESRALTKHRIACIQAATTGKALSIYELANAIHVCHQSALRYVRHLAGNDPANGDRMHVARWREIKRGVWAALYKWGDGSNATKPAPRKRIDLNRYWREKRKSDPVEHALHLARERGKYRAKRAAKTPQTPFSALFAIAGRDSHA